MGFTDPYKSKLFINKENNLAITVHGRTSLTINEKVYDADLDLTYIGTKKSRKSRHDYYAFDDDRGIYALDRNPSGVLKELEAYDLTKFDEYPDNELNVLWMEEHAATDLRKRIERERALARHMKHVQRLHTQYNNNAEKYFITAAAPLNSYESYKRFEQTINQRFEHFEEFEITNYLISNGMASQGVADGVKSTSAASTREIELIMQKAARARLGYIG